jgi:hypothetical protein
VGEGGVEEGGRLEEGVGRERLFLKYLLCNYYILYAYSFIFFSIPIRVHRKFWLVCRLQLSTLQKSSFRGEKHLNF